MRYVAVAMAFFSITMFSHAQEGKTQAKPKMTYMGAYDAGQPGVSIHKMLDPTEDVVCYMLMPDVAGRRQIETDKWIYEGNSIGAISCLKTRLPVIPIQPTQPIHSTQTTK